MNDDELTKEVAIMVGEWRAFVNRECPSCKEGMNKRMSNGEHNISDLAKLTGENSKAIATLASIIGTLKWAIPLGITAAGVIAGVVSKLAEM